MATSKSFFGQRRGSTKTHTFATLRGEQITKDRQEAPRDPRTTAQMRQRMVVKMCQNMGSELDPFLRLFYPFARSRMEARRLFLQVNQKKGFLDPVSWVKKDDFNTGYADFLIGNKLGVYSFTSSGWGIGTLTEGKILKNNWRVGLVRVVDDYDNTKSFWEFKNTPESGAPFNIELNRLLTGSEHGYLLCIADKKESDKLCNYNIGIYNVLNIKNFKTFNMNYNDNGRDSLYYFAQYINENTRFQLYCAELNDIMIFLYFDPITGNKKLKAIMIENRSSRQLLNISSFVDNRIGQIQIDTKKQFFLNDAVSFDDALQSYFL